MKKVRAHQKDLRKEADILYKAIIDFGGDLYKSNAIIIRNKEIHEKHKSGKTPSELSEEYKLTAARIIFICERIERKARESSLKIQRAKVERA